MCSSTKYNNFGSRKIQWVSRTTRPSERLSSCRGRERPAPPYPNSISAPNTPPGALGGRPVERMLGSRAGSALSAYVTSDWTTRREFVNKNFWRMHNPVSIHIVTFIHNSECSTINVPPLPSSTGLRRFSRNPSTRTDHRRACCPPPQSPSPPRR